MARLACAGWFDSIPSPPRPLRKHEKRCRFVGRESQQIVPVDAQQSIDLLGGAIASSDPHNLGWRPVQETALAEVAILGDDDQIVSEGVCPDGIVVRTGEPDIAKMQALRKDARQAGDQPM